MPGLVRTLYLLTLARKLYIWWVEQVKYKSVFNEREIKFNNLLHFNFYNNFSNTNSFKLQCFPVASNFRLFFLQFQSFKLNCYRIWIFFRTRTLTDYFKLRLLLNSKLYQTTSLVNLDPFKLWFLTNWMLDFFT